MTPFNASKAAEPGPTPPGWPGCPPAVSARTGGSITQLITLIRGGDPKAVQGVWERYFGPLVRLASQKLTRHWGAFDEEDVAARAIESVCSAVARGRFPQLEDRDDLWRLLLVVTECRAVDAERYWGRRWPAGGLLEAPQPVVQGPTPEEAALFADECRSLLQKLGDQELRAIALLKMEDNTVEEIAQKLQRSQRTIERKLQLIRRIWREDSP